MEGKGLRDQAQKFEEANCTIVGISFDEPTDNKAFRDKLGFPFSLLSDPDKKVGEAYQVLRPADDPFADYSQRHSYLIAPEGTIVKAYDVTDPAGHAEVVLADLEAALR